MAPRFFRAGRGELHRFLTATMTALQRSRAARNRRQAERARHDMRSWQIERRKRTRRLIELGGLVVKAGVLDLTGDDRAIILGGLLWMAEKLQSDQGAHARRLWAAKGKQALGDDCSGGRPSAVWRPKTSSVKCRPCSVAERASHSSPDATGGRSVFSTRYRRR